MLIVYQHPYSQHSRRVLALLEIANIPYRAETIDLASGEHMSPDFVAINPNHQVPAIIDNKLVLAESHAILRYLCEKHTLVEWYPSKTSTRARIDQWLDWNQCRLSRPVIDVVLNKVFMGEDADVAAIKRGEFELQELGSILAAGLRGNNYLAGDQPTIADLSVASNITQLGLANAIPDHREIRDWYARVCNIEGFSKTLPPAMDAAA